MNLSFKGNFMRYETGFGAQSLQQETMFIETCSPPSVFLGDSCEKIWRNEEKKEKWP